MQYIHIENCQSIQVFIQHALNEITIIKFVDFLSELPIMAPRPEVVWCV